MCKVFMMPGINKNNIQEATRLIKIMSDKMTYSSDDGFGYAAITRDGKIYGEKWRNIKDIWKLKNPDSDGNRFIVNQFGGALKDKSKVGSEIYARFGIARTAKAVEETVGIIMHSRNATSGEKTIQNVHPFFVEQDPDGGHLDTALIHNGNIANHEKLTKTMSTCDSETILHEYIKEMINYNPWGVEKLAKTLCGNYVVGVLTALNYPEGIMPVIDIFKSGFRDIHCAFIDELKAPVFATTKDMIIDACKEAKFTHSEVFEIEGGRFMRVNALTGECVDGIIEFKESSTTDNSYSRGGGYGGMWGGHHDESFAGDDDVTVVNKETQTKNVLPIGGRTSGNLDDQKEDFKKDFLGDKFFVPAKLSDDELKYLEKLASDGDKRPQAVQLVKRALEAAGKVAVQ